MKTIVPEQRPFPAFSRHADELWEQWHLAVPQRNSSSNIYMC